MKTRQTRDKLGTGAWAQNMGYRDALEGKKTRFTANHNLIKRYMIGYTDGTEVRVANMPGYEKIWHYFKIWIAEKVIRRTA